MDNHERFLWVHFGCAFLVMLVFCVFQDKKQVAGYLYLIFLFILYDHV